MLGFRRRPKSGRHALGAAVTGIPSAPPRRAVAVSPPVVPALPQPRVELGFRDGTTTELEPTSAPAQALLELADRLSGRRPPNRSSHEGIRPTSPE